MPKCANGHQTKVASKCQQCGAPVRFKDSLPDLVPLPPPEAEFEETAVLYVGSPPAAGQGAYVAEAVLGKEKSSSKRFVVEKVEGGTWLDYNAKYAEAMSAWLRLVEFRKSKYRLLVVDSTSPLAVLVVNTVPLPESTVVLATYPGRSATPIAQNTSYAALQLARRRGMHVILAVDSFAEHLAVFAEGKGLYTGENAFVQAVGYLLSFLPDVVDLVQKDARLGIGVHFFSVLLSGSDRVFRSLDEAISLLVTQNSLGGGYERVITTHLLASALPDAEKGIKAAFGRLSTAPGQNLMNAEFRSRDKPTGYGLYDLFLLFGVKEPSVFEELRKGYQTIASSASDLSLEGGLSSAPLEVPQAEEEAGEDEPEATEGEETAQASLMKDFLLARAYTYALFLQLRGDPRQALLDFAAEVPSDKPPLEGLVGAYTDWLEGVFDEFVSSLAEKDGPTQPAAEWLSGVVYCIGTVQDSIYSGNAEEGRRAAETLVELGAERARVEGLSLLATTEALIRSADQALKSRLQPPKP